MRRPRLLVVVLYVLSGACAARTAPLVSAPAAEQLFATARADVARLEAESNDARFAALTKLLSERKIGFEVEPFTIAPRKGEARTEGRNVVVTIPGREPEIIVGAHYDAARLSNGALSKGAVDNGASVIVLVRLADALSRARAKNRVRIVFFDMEELGLLGSAQYVQAHRDRNTLAMVNLDVNAFGDTLIYGPRTGTNDVVFQAMHAACIDVARVCVGFPQMPPSDDLSFQKSGIAAVAMATFPQVQAHQLWLLLNGGKDSGLQAGFRPQVLATIHTTSDTSSLVQPEAMARAYRGVLSLIGRLTR